MEGMNEAEPMWVSPCMKRKIVRELMETSGVMHTSYYTILGSDDYLLSSPIKSRPIQKYNTYVSYHACRPVTTKIVSCAFTSNFTHVSFTRDPGHKLVSTSWTSILSINSPSSHTVLIISLNWMYLYSRQTTLLAANHR